MSEQLELFSTTREERTTPPLFCHRCKYEWVNWGRFTEEKTLGQTYGVCPECGAVVAR
jgi:hypothetical protein